ncbi:hypothetical protein [Streptomyces sp. NPDC051567]|uniref:hypothetical protein n=1 Tax=Streptomyces sp. NPDC051567 TaxID=3365660 RepID=UPI00379A8789
MRLRAAITTGALATTIVLSGASAALAYGGDGHSQGEFGQVGTCSIAAGVPDHIGPLFIGTCSDATYAEWDVTK